MSVGNPLINPIGQRSSVNQSHWSTDFQLTPSEVLNIKLRLCVLDSKDWIGLDHGLDRPYAIPLAQSGVDATTQRQTCQILGLGINFKEEKITWVEIVQILGALCQNALFEKAIINLP